MKREVLSLLVILLLAFTAVLAKKKAEVDDEDASPANSDVIVLTQSNFDEVVGKSEFTLVEFYAPWCPHCKDLAPKYEVVATQLKGKVVVAKVNCDKHRELATKYNIPGFPVVKLFKNGKPYRDYEDERSAEAIVAWVNKKTGPAAAALTVDAVESFVKTHADSTNSAIVVGYFSSKDDAGYKEFQNATDSLEDFYYGEVIVAGQKPHVKLFRAHIGESDVETEDFADLQAFLKANGYSLVDEVNGKTFARFASSGLPLAVVFANYTEKESKNSAIELFRKVANEFKGKVNFGFSDGVTYAEQLEIMGGDKTKLPGIAAMNIELRKNFPYHGALNVEELKKWISGILDGSVKPFMRSEPVPEKNDEPVKIVVGKTFEQIVHDATKDVLVEFYAPWCGHCKKLEPKYTKLAQSFASIKDLVIAKIDATQNDVPVNVEGFPTIIFFPAGKKDTPINYDGNRSIADLKKFIYKNASKDVKKAIKELVAKEKNETPKEKTETPKKDEL